MNKKRLLPAFSDPVPIKISFKNHKTETPKVTKKGLGKLSLHRHDSPMTLVSLMLRLVFPHSINPRTDEEEQMHLGVQKLPGLQNKIQDSKRFIMKL